MLAPVKITGAVVVGGVLALAGCSTPAIEGTGRDVSSSTVGDDASLGVLCEDAFGDAADIATEVMLLDDGDYRWAPDLDTDEMIQIRVFYAYCNIAKDGAASPELGLSISPFGAGVLPGPSAETVATGLNLGYMSYEMGGELDLDEQQERNLQQLLDNVAPHVMD